MEDKKSNLEKISNQLDNYYSPEQVGIIQGSIAKNTSLSELVYFLNVCKTMQLNPFNKEVWCYKDNKGNLLIFAGRDGFLSKAQKNPDFAGVRSIEIRENDEYSIDVVNNKITHVITQKKDERGEIIYGVAVVFRKNGEPTIELADFKTYNKGYNTWKSHPAEMIKKVAESHALKKAFGISGIQSEYDFDTTKNHAVPIETEYKEVTEEEDRITTFLKNAETQDDLDMIYPQISEEYLEMYKEAQKRVAYLIKQKESKK